MNRLAWHIPFGIALSISAHLSLITLLNGGANWQSPNSPGTKKIHQPKGFDKETYPTYRESTPSEVTMESPGDILKKAAKNSPELPGITVSPGSPGATREQLALPKPIIKVEPDEGYPVNSQ
jgi:hypothetical protein